MTSPIDDVDEELDNAVTKLVITKNKPSDFTKKEWGSLINYHLTALKSRNQTNFDPVQHKENTKATLAKLFVIGYFIMLLFILIYVPVYNYYMYTMTGNTETLLNAKDAFVMAAGQLGPLLGFVLGYYFKSQD